FFFSLLKDISRGKDSPNYHALKKVARDEKISEQFIVEQAKFILSYFVPYEPKEDYYKILNVSYTASAEEIKRSWLNLMKTYHPDKIGQDGLDITKKLNEAYEGLSDPKKRIEYDARRLPVLPVVVKSFRMEETSKKLIYSVSLVVIFLATVLYLRESDLVFRPDKEKRELAKKGEDTKLKTPETPTTLAMKETLPSKPEEPEVENSFPQVEEVSELTTEEPSTTKLEGEEKEAALLLKESEKVLIAKKEEKKILQPKETSKIKQNKYVVIKEDNLWEIARRFNTSVKNLKETNNLKSNRLDIGDVLIIPGVQQKGVVKKKFEKGKTEKRRVEKLVKTVAKKQNEESNRVFERSQIGQKPKVVKEANALEIKSEVKANQKEEYEPKYSSNEPMSVSYPDKTSLYSFVSEYVSAYKNRDMNLFISFFKPDARENGVEVSKAIPSYRENFSSLEIIGYDVDIKNVDFKDYNASINGDFVVTFKNKNDKKIESSNGTIKWALSWQESKWRVKELNYKIKDTRVVEDE
ncbi:MAG: Jem1p, DnaJ-like protein subfamily er 3, partial [Candidatus Dadabacteria bacterium]|nr:Jem1p, DnaJ-like protein subfamily er 3 [Candidatus Dadabacteria bacterium]